MSIPETPIAGLAEAQRFQHRGVVFEGCDSAPIGNADEYAALHSALGLQTVALPEMVHCRNRLVIRVPGASPASTPTTLTVEALGALESWNKLQQAEHAARGAVVGPTSFDWTYACQYDGELKAEAPLAGSGDTGTTEFKAVPTDEALPLERLRKRDPILFYMACPLYADELHDKGHVETSVKLRVMDWCFLLLVRCYLRLDRDRILIRDVRWFHEFGQSYLLKDVQVRESGAHAVVSALRSSTGRSIQPAGTLTSTVPGPRVTGTVHGAGTTGGAPRGANVLLLSWPGAVFLNALGGRPFPSDSAVVAADVAEQLRLNISADEAYSVIEPAAHECFRIDLA